MTRPTSNSIHTDPVQLYRRDKFYERMGTAKVAAIALDISALPIEAILSLAYEGGRGFCSTNNCAERACALATGAILQLPHEGGRAFCNAAGLTQKASDAADTATQLYSSSGLKASIDKISHWHQQSKLGQAAWMAQEFDVPIEMTLDYQSDCEQIVAAAAIAAVVPPVLRGIQRFKPVPEVGWWSEFQDFGSLPLVKSAKQAWAVALGKPDAPLHIQSLARGTTKLKFNNRDFVVKTGTRNDWQFPSIAETLSDEILGSSYLDSLNLKHFLLPKIHAKGRYGDEFFVIKDYLKGKDLDQWVLRIRAANPAKRESLLRNYQTGNEEFGTALAELQSSSISKVPMSETISAEIAGFEKVVSSSGSFLPSSLLKNKDLQRIVDQFSSSPGVMVEEMDMRLDQVVWNARSKRVAFVDAGGAHPSTFAFPHEELYFLRDDLITHTLTKGFSFPEAISTSNAFLAGYWKYPVHHTAPAASKFFDIQSTLQCLNQLHKAQERGTKFDHRIIRHLTQHIKSELAPPAVSARQTSKRTSYLPPSKLERNWEQRWKDYSADPQIRSLEDSWLASLGVPLDSTVSTQRLRSASAGGNVSRVEINGKSYIAKTTGFSGDVEELHHEIKGTKFIKSLGLKELMIPEIRGNGSFRETNPNGRVRQNHFLLKDYVPGLDLEQMTQVVGKSRPNSAARTSAFQNLQIASQQFGRAISELQRTGFNPDALPKKKYISRAIDMLEDEFMDFTSEDLFRHSSLRIADKNLSRIIKAFTKAPGAMVHGVWENGPNQVVWNSKTKKLSLIDAETATATACIFPQNEFHHVVQELTQRGIVNGMTLNETKLIRNSFAAGYGQNLPSFSPAASQFFEISNTYQQLQDLLLLADQGQKIDRSIFRHYVQNLNRLMSEPVGAAPIRKHHVAPKAVTETQPNQTAAPGTAASSLRQLGRFSVAALPTAIANQDERRRNLMNIFRTASATLSYSAHAAPISQTHFLHHLRIPAAAHPNNLMDTFRAVSAATPFTSRTVRTIPSSSTASAIRRPSHIISGTASVAALQPTSPIQRRRGVEITVLDDAPAISGQTNFLHRHHLSATAPTNLMDTFRAASAAIPLSTSQTIRTTPSGSTASASQRVEVENPQNTQSTTVVANPFPIDTEITPSLSRPRDTTITSTASLGNYATASATIMPSNIRQSAVTIAAPLGNRLSAHVSVVPSRIQQSAVTVTTPISTSSQGVTSVGLILNPRTLTQPQLTLMHTIGSTNFGLVPSRRNQRPDINFSRPIPGVGHVGGIINVRKPLQSTLTAQVPAMILGVPVSIGIDLSLRKFKNSRIHLSLPVQPLNFLLKPLGLKVPGLQIASVSGKKVVKVVKPVLKGFGRLLGFGRCKFSAEEIEQIRLAHIALAKDVAEVRAKRQQLLHFPKDIEELGRLVTELQSIVNELSFYAISDKNVRDIGNAAQDLQEIEQRRQAILSARPSIQESENAVNVAAERLANQVATLPANLQMPTERAVENLRQEQSALTAAITQPASVVASVITATATNRTLQENNAAIAANNATITTVTATASQVHSVLQENRNALTQRLRTRLTPEQARALQTRLG